jgi:hypothetical protein
MPVDHGCSNRSGASRPTQNTIVDHRTDNEAAQYGLWTGTVGSVFVKRWIAIVVGSLLALAALSVVVVKALVVLEVIPDKPWWEAGVLFFVGIVVFIQSIHSIVQNARKPSVEARQSRVHKAALATVRGIAGVTGLDPLALGVSVYVPETKRRWFRKVTRLKRIERLRINDHPQKTDVTWVPHKGAVGEAWARKAVQHKDWTSIAKKYGDKELTDAGWNRVAKATASGFTRDEFTAIAGKYAEILALPIWNDTNTKVLGVLAIDIPMSVVDEKIGTCLNTDASKEIAANSTDTLSKILEKK